MSAAAQGYPSSYYGDINDDNGGVGNGGDDATRPITYEELDALASPALLDPCVPDGWFKAVRVVLISAAVIATLYAIKEFDSIVDDADPEVKREKMRIISSSVTAVGAFLWPVLWDILAGMSVVSHHPLTMFGFLWPMVVGLLDLTYVRSAKNAVQAEKVFGIGELSTDANTLVGVAFAVGSLLSSQSTAVADATVPLLMYALLLLIAFIVPTPSLDPNDYSGFLAGTVQRMFFNYAMGFVVAGISLNISQQGNKGLQTALRKVCIERQKKFVNAAAKRPSGSGIPPQGL
jgi:hypothetical protein